MAWQYLCIKDQLRIVCFLHHLRRPYPQASYAFYSLFHEKPVKFISAKDKKFGFIQDVATLESVVKAEFKGRKVHMTYMNKAERDVSVVLDNPCVK